MDVTTARWLVSEAAAPALALAATDSDAGSLRLAERLRSLVSPAQAAAAQDLVALRRRAGRKAGDAASRLFWTRDGLEQATRADVAARRARLFVERGAARVVDLTGGLGLDALAFADAGLSVTLVESDAVTAVLASANLAERATVVTGDAVALAPGLLDDGASGFVDPARRTSRGRSWRVEDLSPPWPFVLGVLDGSRLACAKLAPGLPHGLIPDAAEAEWVSHAGDVVEAALWVGPGSVPGRRRAVVGADELASDAPVPSPPVGAIAEYVYEPDGAVIRAGLVPLLAGHLGAHRLADGVAYLTADALVRTPFAEAFRVREALPFSEKALRAWVRERRVGVLEIKKRGIDVDPAELRRRLRPTGPNAATLLLTPLTSGAAALVVERVRP